MEPVWTRNAGKCFRCRQFSTIEFILLTNCRLEIPAAGPELTLFKFSLTIKLRTTSCSIIDWYVGWPIKRQSLNKVDTFVDFNTHVL